MKINTNRGSKQKFQSIQQPNLPKDVQIMNKTMQIPHGPSFKAAPRLNDT